MPKSLRSSLKMFWRDEGRGTPGEKERLQTLRIVKYCVCIEPSKQASKQASKPASQPASTLLHAEAQAHGLLLAVVGVLDTRTKRKRGDEQKSRVQCNRAHPTCPNITTLTSSNADELKARKVSAMGG